MKKPYGYKGDPLQSIYDRRAGYSRRREYLKKQRKAQKYRAKSIQSEYVSPFISRITGVEKEFSNSKRKKRISISIPRCFSVIENPRGTLEALISFLEETRINDTREYYFDHSSMKTYDLAAEVILDFFATELSNERNSLHRKKKTSIAGACPTDDTIDRFIRGVGIIDKLGDERDKLKKKDKDKLVVFSQKSTAYIEEVTSGASSLEENVNRDFVKHINDCLEKGGLKLNARGEQKLGEYVGEVLDNIREHSNEYNWHFASYLDTASDKQNCEIALFNFGQTFVQSMLNSKPYTQRIIAKHLEDLPPISEADKECLLTRLALQMNISSKNENEKTSRGQGTIKLIEFFQKVYESAQSLGRYSSEQCKMAILSGATHILFDGKYKIYFDEGLSCIAFNKENSLTKPPDKDYVKNLPRAFPGTVISIKFPLGNEVIEAT